MEISIDYVSFALGAISVSIVFLNFLVLEFLFMRFPCKMHGKRNVERKLKFYRDQISELENDLKRGD